MLDNGERIMAQDGINTDEQHRVCGYTGRLETAQEIQIENISRFDYEKSKELVLLSSLTRNRNQYAPSMLRNVIIIFRIIMPFLK